MKLTTLKEGHMYTAYVLTDASREALLKKFHPKYERVLAHHITEQFGVRKGTDAPGDTDTVVIGYANSGDGIEALVVRVGGTTDRPDGKTYHVTWSLDPAKYKPVDSNALIAEHGYDPVEPPIKFNTTPAVLG